MITALHEEMGQWELARESRYFMAVYHDHAVPATDEQGATLKEHIVTNTFIIFSMPSQDGQGQAR
jgi:hypothetical protein